MARTIVPAPASTWLTSLGIPMRCWRPPADQPQQLDWWQPFLMVCRRAREIHFVWPLWLDEFELIGRVDRSGRPNVWIYRHQRARRELYCDEVGATYRLIATPRGSSPGQLRRCDLTRALFGSGLHNVVDPHWWKHPEDRRPDADSLDRPDWTVPPPKYAWIDAELEDEEHREEAPAAPRRLRLVVGHRAAGQAADGSWPADDREGDRPA